MRRILIPAICLLAICSFSRADDSRHAAALRVIATADSEEVHPDSIFEVSLSLENLSNTVLRIKVPETGWDRLWKSSNRRVSWDAWNSDGDTDTTVEIAPHQTFSFPQTLKMFVDESYTQPRVTFSMGFKTATFKTLWSAPITLDVIP
jgi:hypothetical protein